MYSLCKLREGGDDDDDSDLRSEIASEIVTKVTHCLLTAFLTASALHFSLPSHCCRTPFLTAVFAAFLTAVSLPQVSGAVSLTSVRRAEIIDELIRNAAAHTPSGAGVRGLSSTINAEVAVDRFWGNDEGACMIQFLRARSGLTGLSPVFVTDPEGLVLRLNSLPKGITLCLVNTQASQNGMLSGYHWWAVALKRANDRPPRESCVINMT